MGGGPVTPPPRMVPHDDGTSETQRDWNLQPYIPYRLPLALAAPYLSGDISVSPARPVGGSRTVDG